jgi:non-ribosomal peptide synthase protein (TIGR01720 family)
LSASLDGETTRLLLGEVPAAFGAGVQDILLIAFGLALAQFLNTGTAPIGVDVEGHGRAEELFDDVDLSRTVGWFTTKYPVSLAVGGLSWAQVISGAAALEAVVKDAKEQLRAVPEALSYGVLRYVNPDVELAESDPPIGFNYLGRLAGAAELSDALWRIDSGGAALTAEAMALPLSLAHTLELNAATVDSEAGPRLRADWTWAASALDDEQVNRLSRLWFEALAGICALVRRGGGGLTPVDIAPARLRQHQIDELCRQFEVADVLPLTPLQQGLLFHAGTAQGNDHDDVYAVQLGFTITGALDGDRLAAAVQSMVGRNPHLAARFSAQFDEPVQIIPAHPVSAYQYLERESAEAIEQLCAAERAAVCDLEASPAFRVALVRTGEDTHRCVLTIHHIVVDGWSMPILLQEIFAGYYGAPLPEPVPYRRFVAWLAERDLDAARAAWGQVLAGFDTPTLVGPSDRLQLGPRDLTSYRVSEQTTRALGELARTQHTTLSTVLQAAWALLLSSLTCRHDVVFGAVVSGRPAEVADAESMIGLLINTVPVRATITPLTTTTELLDQLHRDHNHTLEHQHLALTEIHRLTGHAQLFDTVFVYENYPVDTAAMAGADGLTLTESTIRDHYHYPLAVQALPGTELNLLVQYRTDVFTPARIDTLIQRLHHILVAITTNPTQPLSLIDALTTNEPDRRPPPTPTPATDDDGSHRAPATLTEQILAAIYAHTLNIDNVGVNDSFFDLGGDSLTAIRATAAINTALDTHLTPHTLITTPTITNLSQQLGTSL